MIGSFMLTAAVVPALLMLHPPHIPYAFAVCFGIAMGADYMLIPLMVAEECGLSTLARHVAVTAHQYRRAEVVSAASCGYP